ncbi:amidohydrolase family protein [Caldivirga maquilingensis]|uniref:Amidohydrolase n=1 Tax=Caldivirga maquilingensis (strain ATCC 700844 / DSM 13496 / JCM 10307 / IC-167) TaxID=397948 RepID=A8MCW3_CALMQ|nr:amidohydrolase family protein [Caldivirga maquilingensis]ABW01619.1 amidohydrolase [Caldivirga maquilingensis IC-167]
MISVRYFNNGELTRIKLKIRGSTIIELPDNVIAIPAFADMHVHLRDWGESHKEDLNSGSRAALAGGVATVGDMPNTKPPIRNPDLALKRIREASSLKITYKLHGGVPTDLSLLKDYVSLGIKSIKVYPEDYGLIEEIIKAAAVNNMTVIIHCEDPSLFRNLKGNDSRIHSVNRPLDAEFSCALRVTQLALIHGARIHLTHVTDPRVIDLARLSNRITIDATMHHLLLDEDSCIENVNDPFYCKVNPPLRSKSIRFELLRRLIDGSISIIASDHAPHTISEKFHNNYDDTSPGFPGLETTGLLLLDLWRRGLVDLGKVINAYSINPLKVLDVSNDAQLLIDTKSSTVIDPDLFMSKAKHSPFSGWVTMVRLIGLIKGGELLMVDSDYEKIFTGIISENTLIKLSKVIK